MGVRIELVRTILAIGCAIYIMRLEKRLDFAMTRSPPAAPNWESYPMSCALRSRKGSPFHENSRRGGQTLNALLVDAGNLQKRIPEAMRRAGNSWTRSAACRHQHQ